MEALDLRVSVSVDNFGPEGEPGFSESVTAEFEDFVFRQRKPVKLRFIPVTITDAPPDQTFLQL